jgi:uncharacterized RDD family membrane protein YckC
MFTPKNGPAGPAPQGWPPDLKRETAATAALRRLLARREGPTVLAVALALVSLPFVAISLQEYACTNDLPSHVAQLAPSDPARWTAAAGAALFSALIAGFIGGRISHNPAGALLTFLLAWCLGIAAAPMLPAALGQQVGFGGPICIDSCWAPVSSAAPTSGALLGVFLFWLAPLLEGGPFLALLLGFGLWYSLIERFGPRRLQAAVGPARDGDPASLSLASPASVEERLATARYAGVWVRFVALVLDGATLGLVNLIFFTTPAAPLVIAVAVLYAPGLWWALGATPGQMIVGVRVVSAKDLGAITLAMTIVRFVVFLLEIYIFPFVTVGLVWAAFEPRKRAWHDIAARTVVIRTV